MLVTKGEQGERTPTTVREPCSAKLHEHTDNRVCCDCPQRRWCNVFLFCCCTQAILIFLLVEELKNFIEDEMKGWSCNSCGLTVSAARQWVL